MKLLIQDNFGNSFPLDSITGYDIETGNTHYNKVTIKAGNSVYTYPHSEGMLIVNTFRSYRLELDKDKAIASLKLEVERESATNLKLTEELNWWKNQYNKARNSIFDAVANSFQSPDMKGK